ncbi:MAG: RNA methyltransferase [Elusimicrobiaceae bacterium]|nr:RNA methyltransferase [Elusimicrobiaceae bacterium]
MNPAISIKTVLVRPRNSLNVGAAARAMANFGLSELALVDPYEPTWDAVVSAVGAEEIIKNARLHKTVEEAVADCHLVLATTAGQRRMPDRDVVLLDTAAEFIEKRARPGIFKTAVLFGSEKTGLTNEHIAFSHALLNIPTYPGQPSMNLGQAVAVTCYELSKTSGRTRALTRAGGSAAVTVADIERLARDINRVFRLTSIESGAREETRLKRIRRVLFELNLSYDGLKYARSLASKIQARLDSIEKAANEPESA